MGEEIDARLHYGLYRIAEFEDGEVHGDNQAADDDAAPPDDQAVSGEEAPEAEPAEIQPAIEPPASWDASAKDEFAKLPPAVQRRLAEREREREQVVSTRNREAAESKKALEQSQQERVQQLARLKELEDTALGDPIIQWGDKADWVKLAAEVEPQTFNQYQATYHQRKQGLARLQHERAELFRQAQSAAVSEAQKELAADLGDEFTDDAKWRPLVSEVVGYLRDLGVPKEYWDGVEDRKITNAKMFKVAVDAVKGRRLLKAKDTLPSKKVQPQARPAAKPRAVLPAPQVNKSLQAKLHQARKTGRDDDAIAAIEAAILSG